MRTTWSVAHVEAPSVEYVKAIVDVTEDSVMVMDRSRTPLMPPLTGEQIWDGQHRLTVDGVSVRNMVGACGCGGLRVINKEQIA